MKAFRTPFHVVAVVVCLGTATIFAGEHKAMEHTSTMFQGKVVNGGTVTHYREGGKSMLRLSADFQIPGSPDPHWQVVDSNGEAHLLQSLKVKEGLSNREIAMPGHVPDVAKVQIWCSFAQVLLGEASFDAPVK